MTVLARRDDGLEIDDDPARVDVDRTFHLVVDEPYRGRGIGRWLMTTVGDAVEATGVRRQVLATADAHEVYRAVGWTELANPERWMEIDRRDL